MTHAELRQAYDSGWMPILPIDDKYSASLLPAIHRWRPAMATQIRNYSRTNTSIINVSTVIVTDRPVMSCGFVQHE